MSHFPGGQVVSTTPGWPAGAIRQGPAYATQRTTLATYKASVDFRATGAKVLFTTEAARGRFVPLSLAVYVTDGFGPGATGPAWSVGWNPANTQPYIEWVNQDAVTAITTSSFGSGNYTIQSDTWAFTWGQYFLSAPASTAVVGYVYQASTATRDTRTVLITGFYTG